MSLLNAHAHNEARWLTDDMVEAVRNRDMTRLAGLSPAAGCLAPLLLTLGFEERISEVIEALPANQNSFNLVDLRNTLVNLGITSSRQIWGRRDIPPALLPCILTSKEGSLYVVTRQEATGYMYYVADEDRYDLGELPEDLSEAFFFTDTRSEIEDVEVQTQTSWLNQITGRFRPTIWVVLAMSFVVNALALSVPLFILAVYDGVIGANYPTALPYLIFGIVGLIGIEAALRWLRALATGQMTARADFLVATESFRHLLRLPPMAVERSDLGTQLSYLKQFDALRDFLAGPSMLLLYELPFLPLYVLVIGLIAGPLLWVPMGMLVAFLLIGFAWDRHTFVGNQDAQRTRGRRNQMLFDVLSGLIDIRTQRKQMHWLERFRASDAYATDAKLSEARQLALLKNLGIALTGLFAVILLFSGANMVMQEDIGSGALIAAMVIVWRLGGILQSGLQFVPRIRPLIGVIRQVNAVMELPVEKRLPSASMLMQDVKGSIEFEGVSFRYEAEGNPALINCTFAAEHGDMIALTGLSGAGKSTILKLISGLYRPQAGVIRINGLDVRQLDPQALRHMISYLPHDAQLLHGTVADNIRLNQPDAKDGEIVRAADEANILHLIRQLPEGFNTQVQTSFLSSSVVYGIGLARAFLRRCPILLLDEPGVNFDNDSDRRLNERLAQRKHEQTIIMATHRPSQIALASRVLVLDNGRLATT